VPSARVLAQGRDMGEADYSTRVDRAEPPTL